MIVKSQGGPGLTVSNATIAREVIYEFVGCSVILDFVSISIFLIHYEGIWHCNHHSSVLCESLQYFLKSPSTAARPKGLVSASSPPARAHSVLKPPSSPLSI